jgi:hypothetical protein
VPSVTLRSPTIHPKDDGEALRFYPFTLMAMEWLRLCGPTSALFRSTLALLPLRLDW